MNNGNLTAEYIFSLDGKYKFKPTISIPLNAICKAQQLNYDELRSFIFHIGMVELVSYWKAACPKEVRILPHSITKEQIRWWKKLYFHGLGEFFYLNNIEATMEDFMSIKTSGTKVEKSHKFLNNNKVLVPVGGGKDSVVTLELLKKSNLEVIPMAVNPREATNRTIRNAGFNLSETLVINRTIDPLLIKLNSEGFLNGHTPFSALLAFVGVLGCMISGVSNIALSNESSANESTVPGTKVNHQYSKSYEFELDFDNYVRSFLNDNINYFSFLRPLNELQIASQFSKFEQHFSSFRSCNVGSKKDIWCGSCPKCMFTYIILSPFINSEKLDDIFGKKIMEDESLLSIYKELAGISEVKPFECVGTPEEVNAAMSVLFKNNPQSLVGIPATWNNNSSEIFDSLLEEYNTENLLPENFKLILKKAMNG